MLSTVAAVKHTAAAVVRSVEIGGATDSAGVSYTAAVEGTHSAVLTTAATVESTAGSVALRIPARPAPAAAVKREALAVRRTTAIAATQLPGATRHHRQHLAQTSQVGISARAWKSARSSPRVVTSPGKPEGYNEVMSPTAEKLLQEVLTLNQKDQASFAEALIESLHGPGGQCVEEAWDAEIRRRVEELESGAVQGIPWAKVRERLFRGFE